MNRPPPLGLAAVLALAVGLAGCGSLFGPLPPAPHYWVLDAAAAPTAAAAVAAVASAPVLVVAAPHAAAGFDTDRIVYVMEAHGLQPYADNQWIDTPARMIAPLIAESIARSRAFGAVLDAPSPARGGWQLDTQVVRLQHEVPAGRVRFTLRATLVAEPGRSAVAAREFDAVAPTPSANPAGAVAAANVAVADVLQQLAAWCVAVVESPPASPSIGSR